MTSGHPHTRSSPSVKAGHIDVGLLIDSAGLNPLSKLVLALACLTSFMEGLDLSVISYVAPYIRDDLKLPAQSLGNVFSASVLGMLIGGLAISPLGDRFGRRPVIVFAGCAFALMSVLQVSTASYVYLLGVRFFLGLSVGAIGPLLTALAIEYAPQNLKIRFVGFMVMSYSLGAAASGPLTAAIAPELGWRAVFVVNGLLTAAAAVALLRFLPESIRFMVHSQAPASVIASLVNRLAPATRASEADRFVVCDERRDHDGARITDLLAGDLRFVTPMLWLGCAASAMAIYFNASWGPIIYEGLSIERNAAAIFSSAASLSGAIAGLATTHLIDRRGVVSAIWFPLSAVPLLLVAGSGMLPPEYVIAFAVPASVLLIAGHFGMISIIGTYYPTAMRVRGIAWATSIAKVGGATGPAIGGNVMAAGIPLTSSYLLLAVCPIVVALSLLAIAHRTAMSSTRLTQ
ncbi:MFS transporter [Novosphingobium sp. ZN18A2]|uniref:MFS transporter n=1 Tax=Novosphingobium sp. ZN18A2 TaxID=3079861 RepID=UPI0030CC7B26